MYPPAVHKRVAELHKQSIDQGFLPVLGVRFLTILYWAIDSDKDSVLIVEESEGEVLGFVSASLGMRCVVKRMLHRPLSLFCALFPSLFRIGRIIKILEVLRYASSSHSGKELPKAELLSIAVTPSFRGKKVSDRLYDKLKIHFKSKNVSAFCITVGSELKNARSFYDRMGASPSGLIEVHAGKSSVVYVQEIH